jgi:hypothetical protein
VLKYAEESEGWKTISQRENSESRAKGAKKGRVFLATHLPHSSDVSEQSFNDNDEMRKIFSSFSRTQKKLITHTRVKRALSVMRERK